MTGWYSYLVSLDLGQSQDFSALSLIEIPVWRPVAGVWASPADMDARRLAIHAYAQGTPPSPRPLHVRTLRRFALGTSYPDIVRSVVRLLHSGTVAGKGVALLIDQTGVGAPV